MTLQVVLARINALVGTTYHARMHIQRADGSGMPIDIDARPSDAINMAMRFQAPLFVCKTVAAKMAVHRSGVLGIVDALPDEEQETQGHIIKSCKSECALYKDPTVIKNLQLALAIEEERFEDASLCALPSPLFG
jgi:uncharacterized protein